MPLYQQRRQINDIFGEGIDMFNKSLHSFPLVDCAWSKWDDWSHCSESCGDGWTSRSRYVVAMAENGGSHCKGQGIEEKRCNIKKCPGIFIVIWLFSALHISASSLQLIWYLQLLIQKCFLNCFSGL